MLASFQAHAVSIANIGSMNCSGIQTVSFFKSVSLGCSGDFSISDGTIESDSKISITSGGSLSIDNATLSAPTIELVASNMLIGSDVVFGAPEGSITLSQGSDIGNSRDSYSSISVSAGRGTLLVGNTPGSISVSGALNSPNIDPVQILYPILIAPPALVQLPDGITPSAPIPLPAGISLFFSGILLLTSLQKRNNLDADQNNTD